MSTAGTSASTGLFLGGQRESGDDVRQSNVTAAISIANIVKSSLGPIGLDKMLVDDIGDVIITNDGATILSQIEIEHPAARLLVDLAKLQDREVGDGTTSVVLMAAELLKRGYHLTNGRQLHPTTVLAGYKMALKQSIQFIKQNMVVHMDHDNNNDNSDNNDNNDNNDQLLLQAARTSMSSKIIGKEGDYFAKLAVDAAKSVQNPNTKKVPLSAIHILKAHGKASLDSQLLKHGFAIQASRAAQGMPVVVNPSPGGGSGGEDDGGPGGKEANNTNTTVPIAMLDMNLQRHRMGLGITITVSDPKEVEKIKQRELDITKEKIHKIIHSGARVVLTTKGMDDVCMKYFVEAGILCARRCDKNDLKRLAKATGGHVVTTIADLDGEETFDYSSLGHCSSVREVQLGDNEMFHFDGCCIMGSSSSSGGDEEVDGGGGGGGGGSASTIILRGPNEYMLDEMDRALHDALCVVKRMLESSTLVPGGGAVEAALSVYLEQYATTCLSSREQLAIHEFAEAMLVIPKTLAVNAAKDSSELVAQLRAIHAKSQKENKTEEEEKLKNYGLDLVKGEIRDNLAAGVVEPAMSKIKSLRFATEAAITILRIDDRITVQKDN